MLWPLYSLLVHLWQTGTVFFRGAFPDLFLQRFPSIVTPTLVSIVHPFSGLFTQVLLLYSLNFRPILFLDFLVTHACIIAFDFYETFCYLLFRVSVSILAAWIFGAKLLSLMHCYVFFRCWLVPSLLFSCLCCFTCLAHLDSFHDLNF